MPSPGRSSLLTGLRHLALLGASLLVIASGGCGVGAGERNFLRGVWIAEHGGKGFESSEARTTLRRIRDLGAEWLAVGPEAHMEDIHRPDITFGERDGYYVDWIRQAKKAGFKIMLLPRIESPAFFKPPHPFRADIEMKSKESWGQFFDRYEAMITHFARIAEREGVELLSIGLEYRKCINADPGRWRAMARTVRTVYSGKLTYSANWWKEYLEVTFWDDLDFIGIGAYFEVADESGVGLRALSKGWQPVIKELETLSRKTGKPVLFTETGYPTYADAGRYPWKWQFDTARRVDPDHQATCFKGLFENLVGNDWFAGLFVWRFFTYDRYVKPWEYTPEGKPAEAVIRSWYRR